MAKNIGRGGIAAMFNSKTIVSSVIVYLLKLELIKGLVRPLKVISTSSIVTKYRIKKNENVIRLPDMRPKSRKELLAMEETTIR